MIKSVKELREARDEADDSGDPAARLTYERDAWDTLKAARKKVPSRTAKGTDMTSKSVDELRAEWLAANAALAVRQTEWAAAEAHRAAEVELMNAAMSLAGKRDRAAWAAYLAVLKKERQL